MLVVDASVVTLWFLPQARSAVARELLRMDDLLVGPLLLQLEVGSALLRAVRRNDLEARVARDSTFTVLPSTVDLIDLPSLLMNAYALASVHGGSLSDAVYVALARGIGATLVTDDAQMRTVALRARVDVRLLEGS